jgi:hypothetical protein
MLDTVVQDLRYAIRVLSRNRGVTAVAVQCEIIEKIYRASVGGEDRDAFTFFLFCLTSRSKPETFFFSALPPTVSQRVFSSLPYLPR